jgi:diacylglycerol kinase (ATP)
MSGKKYLVVFNNESGKKKARSLKAHIYSKFKENNKSFKFISIKTLKIIANIEQYDTIVAVGGDGTVLELLPYVIKSDSKLGIIPCGTANLFASSLFIPENLNKALDILLMDHTSKVDIGKAGDKYFSLRVGMGFDADIIKDATSELKHKFGYLAYLLQGFINALRLTNKSYKVTIDGNTFDVNANSIIVANAGNMFKRFFSVAPFGSSNDGMLDVFILKTKNFAEFLGVFWQILTGRHKINHSVMYAKARVIHIESLQKGYHIDGEYFQLPSVDISIIPKGLKVLVP